MPEESIRMCSLPPSELVNVKVPVEDVFLNSAFPPEAGAKLNISFATAPVPKVNLAPLTGAIPIPTLPVPSIVIKVLVPPLKI